MTTELLYSNGLGGFAPDGMSYIVTSLEVPRDWFNTLCNPMYTAFVRGTARGRSFYLSPVYNWISSEQRAFYLRDADSGEYWSPTGWPVRRDLQAYRSEHSADTTIISSRYRSIDFRIQAVVPVEGDCELWQISVRNRSKRQRRLSLFSVFPMLLWNMRWAIQYYQTGRYDEAAGALWFHTTCNQSPQGLKYFGFVAADPKPDAWDTSEVAFTGATRTAGNPLAVERGRLSGTIGHGEPLVAAMQHDLTLAVGEKTDVHLLLGVTNGREEMPDFVAHWRGRERFEQEARKARQWWRGHVAQPLVHTPDAELDLMANVWIRRQLVLQVITRRSASGGATARNIIQDMLGYLPFDPAPCRQALIDACRYQYPNGFIPMDWPTYEPADMEGLSRHRDSAIWAAATLAAYARETGDRAVLDEVVPYREGGVSATVLEHMLTAMRFLIAETGSHGLSLFGGGDWNDPLENPGKGGKGESTWTSMALTWALKEMAGLLRQVNKLALADEMLAAAAQRTQAVNAQCWDGQWYNRGFVDAGYAFGVHTDEEGRIYINPQTWSVIAGVATPERAAAAWESMRRLLDTDSGTAMLAPPYTKYRDDLGRITNKLPGNSENGSIYNHSVMFKAYAECMLGRGQQAWETLRSVLPTVRQHPVDKTLHTPMSMPNAYEPMGRQTPPRSTELYQTGAVPWFMMAVMEGLLGVKATWEGLTIDPCLPPSWQQCAIRRRYRGGEYEITIRNPHGLEKGRVRLTVDGEAIEGNVLPPRSGKHTVEAVVACQELYGKSRIRKNANG